MLRAQPTFDDNGMDIHCGGNERWKQTAALSLKYFDEKPTRLVSLPEWLFYDEIDTVVWKKCLPPFLFFFVFVFCIFPHT